MKKYNNIVCSLALAFAVCGCADYVDTSDFKVEKPESISASEYLEAYEPLKTYLNRDVHPNFKLGVALPGDDYNSRAGLYALACSNFDMATIYSEMMYGNIVDNKGNYNYEAATRYAEAVARGEQVGFGHAITSSKYQNVTWLKAILSNAVANLGEEDKILDCSVDYSTTDTFPFSTIGTFTPVVKDGVLFASLGNKKTFYLAECDNISPEFNYEFNFNLKASKNITLTLRFGKTTKAITCSPEWQEFVVELPVEGDATGLILDPGPQKVDVEIGSVVMKHKRALTLDEKDNLYSSELERWIEGLMRVSDGAVKVWDLANEPLADSGDDGSGHYPLLAAPAGSKTEFYWQDCFGDVKFLKLAYDYAVKYYAEYGGEGTPTFYVNESCLDDVKKAESLVYWVKKWESNGIKIDGIGTKMHVVCSEVAATDADVKAKITKNLEALAASGKEIMISELEVTYEDATGMTVAAADLTAEQQKTLSAFYSWVFDTYFAKVAADKQAGITLWNLVENGNSTALWDKDLNRKALYALIADALKGK